MKIKPKTIQLKVPLLNGDESIFTLGKWLVTVNEQVEIDQDLVELISETESFILPAPVDGVLVTIEAETEEKVEPGQVLAIIETD